MMQLLRTATLKTIDLSTLIDLIFHNQIFDDLDSGIFEGGLTNHCAIFVKLQLFCRKQYHTETTCKVFPLVYKEKAKKKFWNCFQINWKNTIFLKTWLSSLKK